MHPRSADRPLRRARRQLGLSQPEFGERLSIDVGRPISADLVSKYERGVNETPLDVLDAAARLAQLTVDELLHPGVREDDHQRLVLLERRVGVLEERMRRVESQRS